MKLRPTTLAPRTHCVRCNTAFDPAGVQVRATCSPCATDLRKMHEHSEYTFFRRTYYACSTDGTSLLWLLANGWSKDITLPPLRNSSRPARMVQARVDKALESSA